MTTARTITDIPAAWEDARDWKAECDRREAERSQPVAFDCDWQKIATIACAFLMGCTLGGLFS